MFPSMKVLISHITSVRTGAQRGTFQVGFMNSRNCPIIRCDQCAYTVTNKLCCTEDLNTKRMGIYSPLFCIESYAVQKS